MYDFKHQIHQTQRFNTYELYIEKDKITQNSYKMLRNTLFLIAFILTIFITGAISLKSYQEYKKSNSTINTKRLLIETKIQVTNNQIKLSHSELSRAITNSVVRNLQSKEGSKTIDNDELKRIIKKVVNKIQEEPNSKKYTQQQRITDVL